MYGQTLIFINIIGLDSEYKVALNYGHKVLLFRIN